MDDVLQIPGNQRAYERLLKLLRSHSATALVGAGASAGLYPLWGTLLGELIDQVKAHKELSEKKEERWRTDGMSKPLITASRLRDELGVTFFDFLTWRFAPAAEGPAFTATHAALAALPFQGFVTTNYDIGLTQAIARRETHRPPATWRDAEVARWLRDEHPGGGRPVLHAHGVYSSPESLVLDRDRYGEAYAHPPFHELSRQLWRSGRLVTVGFSFRDPWLDLLADQAIRCSGQKQSIAPGHVAIVGLDDLDELDDLRFEISTVYHGNVLVYPIEDGRHDALGRLLEQASRDLDADTATIASEETPGPSTLGRWLELVTGEHRRLTDHFDRPAELSLLETAWVRLELTRAPAEREMLAEDARHERGVPARSTLEHFLELDRSDPAQGWVTGRWLVEGDPGSGKTTLLRYLASRRAQATRRGEREEVPLFLSLPKLTEPLRMPLDFVREEFAGRCGDGLVDALDDAGRAGRLLVLLDALDEVPPERRERAGRVLSWLSAEWPGSTVVMSSRPIGQGSVPPDFVKLELQPLEKAQRLEFLTKWFGAERTAKVAAKHFDREQSLQALSLNPLHLTLLAVLWERGIEAPRRRSALYDEILAMLLAGKHREADKARAMEPQAATREILQALAMAHTEADLPSESPEQLADRLLDDELDVARSKIEKKFGSHRDFLDAVHERTYILGPHDGESSPWRFWHRTLREALTAERLEQERQAGSEQAILQRVEQLEDEDEGRWAEPFALLAGRPGADRLIVELTRRRPSLGVRALETAQDLGGEALVELLDALDNPRQRGAVFEAIPSQLGAADASLELIDQLRDSARGGNDLFFLDLACRLTADRWPAAVDAATELRGSLYEQIPTPPAELFRRFRTPKGESKDLWCTIPAGVYPVGSDDHDDDEKPRHPVKIVQPYAMAAVPVTNAQYAVFDPAKKPRVWAGVSEDKLGDHPRVNVTWWEAVAFCRWLATLGFEGARLPSEEEWEVACRAGSETDYWNGNGKKALDSIGWYDANAGRRTHRVAGKRANRWGLYDVHGNAREWTATPWDEKAYRDRSPKEPFEVDPAEEPADDLAAPPRAVRVIRGGSFWSTAGRARSAYRDFRNPWIVLHVQGFRVLLPSPERS